MMVLVCCVGCGEGVCGLWGWCVGRLVVRCWGEDDRV